MDLTLFSSPGSYVGRSLEDVLEEEKKKREAEGRAFEEVEARKGRVESDGVIVDGGVDDGLGGVAMDDLGDGVKDAVDDDAKYTVDHDASVGAQSSQ